MKIKCYGHSCFELQLNDGIKVITDPFDESVGYEVPGLECDIVTVSHEHHDHNNLYAVNGDYILINNTGNYEAKGIAIEGILTYHDDDMGRKRGKNIVYKYTIDGMTLCHLGDLGHILEVEQLEKLKGLDVLLIPVGGIYTINSIQAAELVKQLSPKVIIPMHYKTEKLKFDLEPVDNFVRAFETVKYVNESVLEIHKGMIDEDNRVIIMQV